MSYNFDSYRKWFNQLFKLSFDGKFKGLSFIRNLSHKMMDLFVHKLSKLLRHNDNKMQKSLGDVVTFRLSGHIVKLYSK